MRENARVLHESTGLMREKVVERRMFKKRRRFCRASKILGGPEGCLAQFLLWRFNHEAHEAHEGRGKRK